MIMSGVAYATCKLCWKIIIVARVLNINRLVNGMEGEEKQELEGGAAKTQNNSDASIVML